MAATTYEQHTLTETPDQPCEGCHQFTATHTRLAIVEADTLRLLTTVTRSTCPCGQHDLWR